MPHDTFISSREPIGQAIKIIKGILDYLDTLEPQEALRYSTQIKQLSDTLLACERRNFQNAHLEDYERMPTAQLLSKLPEAIRTLEKLAPFDRPSNQKMRTPEEIDRDHSLAAKKALEAQKKKEQR